MSSIKWTKHLNFQTINGLDGRPAFVVVPYEVFIDRYEQAGDLIPNEVVNLMFGHDMTAARAWRTHLKLTQDEIAKRMGSSQSAYARLEESRSLSKSARAKIAAALGIRPAQFDLD